MAFFHQRSVSFYENFLKRFLDVACSLCVVVLFSWLYLLIALLIRIFLGKPVIFKQYRPGKIDPKTGTERIFCLYKFRTMSDNRDEHNDLLPDELRLGEFGKFLRSTSLDELPEVVNILRGDMSIVGPRPQLVRDMVFMSNIQRKRHTVKPGLTGLAQVKGRNAISWEDKLDLDLEYIENITFLSDLRIIFQTFRVALFKREGISDGVNATALDYGDSLLSDKVISFETYSQKLEYAEQLLNEHCRNVGN